MTQRDPSHLSRSPRSGRTSVRVLLTVMSVIGLAACTSGTSGDSSAPPSAGASSSAPESLVTARVAPTEETDPVHHDGDAADDPAIWVDPDDPARSVLVGTDKKGGLLVYDLSGKELQYLQSGDMNNVDVRPAGAALTLGGRPVVLVVSGNRTDNTIGVFELDPRTRQLQDVAAGPITPALEVYGSCVYHSAATGSMYAFVNSKKGEVEQWALTDDGSGKVAGRLVRSFAVSSQVEGCVADDEQGAFYLGEEKKGIWKFGAEPDAGNTGTLIAQVSPSGPLVGQVEGLTLAYDGGGTGYLIASSQGDSSYAVFRREGDNAYVGTFRIVAARGIDGTDGTDGIDVTTADLGPSFPSGVFVSQDGKNDGGAQNYKLVPLQEILAR